ncbi:hypothetical protein BaRGS_00039174 [Batillaria attramentaria]|uniref:Uncharacterized protein n=1 Tax=Batillaria attramentaria TaxID=370345 RepID=A0ABD0J403_9CAEN
MNVHARCLFLLLLWTLSADGTSAEPCAVFEFPNVTNSILTAQVNSTIDLPFTIKPGPNCHLSNEVTIRVRMREGDKYGDFCSIRQSLGSCHIPLQENGCGCRSGRNLYRLKKTADRIDSTQWLFTTDDGMVQNKELTFNILYPATVESLTINSGRLDGQSQVVEPGLPEFPEEAGRKRVVRPGHTEIDFPVRTYTNNISQCRLTKRTSEEADTTDSPPTTSVRQRRSLKFGWFLFEGQQPTEIQPASPFPGRALPEVPGCSASSGGQRAPRTYRESAENDGYLSPALPLGQAGEQRSGTYERPPAAPDYTTPNAAYEPLRHLYESFRQWRRSKRVSQTLEEEG